jgi:hypothetical protein
MTPDFPALLVDPASRGGLALEELRAALGRAGMSTQLRPVGDHMTAFAWQASRVSAFVYAVGGDPDALTRFVASVRGMNPAVPIYLFGEASAPRSRPTRSSVTRPRRHACSP